MVETSSLKLELGGVDALVHPAQGGVLTHLRVAGRSVLAVTDWEDAIAEYAAPAESEEAWVERWRGGWQLCFPSAGLVDPGSELPQAFHGVASQAPWDVLHSSAGTVALGWSDDFQLSAVRTWRLTPRGASVETNVHNRSATPRAVVIAEHLVLGADLLRPVVDEGAALSISPPPGTVLAELDYSGHPLDRDQLWPGEPAERWPVIDAATPPRVAALRDVVPPRIRIDSAHASATVSWEGLPHALLWEELARSPETPWNESVLALGVEPTSAPHGAGTAIADGTILLQPGESVSWSAELAVEWRTDESPEREHP